MGSKRHLLQTLPRSKGCRLMLAQLHHVATSIHCLFSKQLCNV